MARDRNLLLALIGALAVAFSASPAMAACSNPAGVAGDQIYSSNYNVMQYCNGTNWVNMGVSGSMGALTADNFCRVNAAGTQLVCNVPAIDLTSHVTGNLPVANLNGGTNAGTTTFWRGDGTWAVPPVPGSVATLTTPRDFSIAGDATAPAVSFDGSANVILTASVIKLQGYAVSSTAPSADQALVWNGSAWTPGAVGQMASGTSAALPGLYFAGDANTGLHRPADDTMVFSTAGTERLRIDASGNIGVGAAPQTGAALDLSSRTGPTSSSLILPQDTTANRPGTGVPGMVRYNTSLQTFEGYTATSWTTLLNSTSTMSSGVLLGGSTSAANPYREGEANTGLYSPGTGSVAITSLGGEVLRVTATKSIGFGTSVPVVAFDMDGKVDAIRIPVGATGDRPGSSAVGMMRYNTTLGAFEGYTASGWGSIGGSSQWITSGSNIYYNTGNVGIGTTTPGAKLHVANPSGAGSIFVSGASGTSIEIGSGTTTNQFAYIDLVGDTTYFDYGLRLIRSNTGANADAALVNRGTGVLTIAAQDAGSINLAINNVSRLYVTSTGNVGIGTTAPGYLLHVNGTAYATGAAGALSDERHKKNVKALEFSGLDVAGKLRPVTFEWKEPRDEGMKGEQIGFIAQEVEKVLPQAVLTESNAEKTKGLKYNEIIPILVKAVQELIGLDAGRDAKIDALIEENKKLRKDMDSIKELLKKKPPG